MEFTFSELLVSFIYSVLMGFALGLLYEPVRVLHLINRSDSLYLVTDILFMLFCGLVTYFYFIATIEGRVRVFVIIGELCGYFLFFRFVRPILTVIYLPLIDFLQKFLKKLLKKYNQISYNITIKSRIVIKTIFSFFGKVVCYGSGKFKNRKETGSYARKGRHKRSKAQKEKKK